MKADVSTPTTQHMAGLLLLSGVALCHSGIGWFQPESFFDLGQHEDFFLWFFHENLLGDQEICRIIAAMELALVVWVVWAKMVARNEEQVLFRMGALTLFYLYSAVGRYKVGDSWTLLDIGMFAGSASVLLHEHPVLLQYEKIATKKPAKQHE